MSKHRTLTLPPKAHNERVDVENEIVHGKLAEDADTLTSAKERALADLEAKLAFKLEEMARLEKMFVTGDTSELDLEHPFELTVQATPGPGGSLPARVGINGMYFNIPREEPVVVPKKVIEVLKVAKYDQWEKQVGPDGNPINVRNTYHRYPYMARPLFDPSARDRMMEGRANI